jgi:2-oxoglutarate dehydrogenase E1 component
MKMMPATGLKAFEETSYLYGGNARFIEDLYARYLDDPALVTEEWRHYFDQLQDAAGWSVPARAPARPAPPPPVEREAVAVIRPQPPMTEGQVGEKQAAVQRLVAAYRLLGYQRAQVDPIHLRPVREVPELDPAYYDLGETELSQLFCSDLVGGPERRSLREILEILKEVYCGTIGAEFIHILDGRERMWVQTRFEQLRLQEAFSPETRRLLLERLSAAEGLERYLHNKYVGQKRFSLEGAESLIPILDELIQRAGAHGVREIVIGMAHRGRLNVLINILGKSPRDLFLEFEGRYDFDALGGSGDVKYHLGYSSDVSTAGGQVHLALAFNPSHLEIINPVVEGSVRARQQRRRDAAHALVMPVLIHGDAAFAGQGVVMETLNLSQTRGYRTGGTVHIVVNNQIGFTTSYPQDMRSTLYATDIAKVVQAPIFHVNGDDPEAVLSVTQLALDYRMRFKHDVVIDLVCYRRHGHNEADEPAATQPMMYRNIKDHPTTVQIYAERLVKDGTVSPKEVEVMASEYRQALDEGRVVARQIVTDAKHHEAVDWSLYKDTHWTYAVDTRLPREAIRELSDRLLALPEGFQLHPRVARIMEDRRKMAAGALGADWGFAETLAYTSLVREGYQVRLSGQDSGRGTFFHRHAVLHNQKDGSSYVPLQHIAEDQAPFIVIDSLLSEEAVLGFEYGYATAEPRALVVWEAQFGDFANGAQVVIDQFISSGETKWGRLCGLVMWLPHGYEGQGPEHSSARLERYLQLCAEHNLQVCVPTTPAQIFHLLRRQMLRPYRKPLVVMSPKSLLRHKLSVSHLEDFSEGTFQPVIGEIGPISPQDVHRVVLGSGKVYYDLLEQRRARELHHIAILRLEQLYPFPRELLTEQLKLYAHAKDVVWCQEEPMNQGAWYQSQHHLYACLRPGQTLRYAGRPASASPAVGYFAMHIEQQLALVDEALTGAG